MSTPPLPGPQGLAVNPDGRFTQLWYRAFLALWSAIDGGLGSGEVRGWAPAAVPDGWLRTNGAAVSRATYRDLFNAIGSAYGAGDGSTTFNLPNWSVGGVPLIIRA
jgi:hypothetical protein